MSGGHFDQNQHKIGYIAESIESIIERNRTPVDKKDRWGDWDDREFYYDYPDVIIEKFKKGVRILREAEVYAQRIDWLISGDDSEKTFLKRLKEDLDTL